MEGAPFGGEDRNGEELMREGDWRGIGMKQRGSGRLGKACLGIA